MWGKFILFVVVAFVSAQGFANYPLGASAEKNKEMIEHNRKLSKTDSFLGDLTADVPPSAIDRFLGFGDMRPFAEYESAGYLIYNATYDFNSEKAKKTMAQFLPEDMDLVIYTGRDSPVAGKKIRKEFSRYIDPERVKVVHIPEGGNGFWARDAVPVPVIRERLSGDELNLVDARYYHEFEPDAYFSELFQSSLSSHEYYFEGGNFVANSQGHCLVVNTEKTDLIPDQIFYSHYGCSELTRLPFIKGIGHADESVKFVSDNVVLTDAETYAKTLEEAGFEVYMLPRPNRKYETYVNSLIVNGTVFVPVFGQGNDDEAIAVYESMGLEVVAINSRRLSNGGMGSLHCITMTYPPVDILELTKAMGGHLL